jgi:hypothetical protein
MKGNLQEAGETSDEEYPKFAQLAGILEPI